MTAVEQLGERDGTCPVEAGLRENIQAKGLDTLFVAKRHSVRYISGYTGDDSYLFITADRRVVITDPRYTEQAETECPGWEIVNWRAAGKTVADAVADLVRASGARSVGFEGDCLCYALYRGLAERTDAALVDTAGLVEELRTVKTPAEIHCLRAACEIACRAFERILGDIRVGRTEKELAARLSLYMVEEGADTQPYGNILISGARTSLLHGIPSEKAVEYGDFVLLDFGCAYRGYLSDMTRTVVVGRASGRQREVYALEKRMVEDSLAVMKAGTPAKAVYDASVDAIAGTPYFDYHYTGIGHGIGLFVHEPHFFGPNSDAVLAAGNVTTIEPGLYLPGWGGVRIEDQVLVTAQGCENMVRIPRDLIEL